MQTGERYKEMFVLLTGQCEIRTPHADGRTETMQTVHVGQVIGLTSLVGGHPSQTTLTASKESNLLVLNWDSIQRGARLYPRGTCHLYRNLSIILGVRFE